MKVWLSIAFAMHGAAALGAMALGVGHGGPPAGEPLGSVDVEVALPDPKPMAQEAPAQQVAREVAPVTRSISAVNVGHGSPTPVQAPVADVGPDRDSTTADPAPSTPPRFTISLSTTGASHESGDATDPTTTSSPIVDATQVTTPSTLARSVTPAYPNSAREDGVEATVRVEIVVDESGKVIDSRALSHEGYGFEEAALAALRDYRFTPAKVGERLVRVRMPWSVEFRLR